MSIRLLIGHDSGIFFSSLLLPPSNIIANLQRQINIYIYIDIRLRAWAHLSWFWIYVYLDRFVKCFFVMILLVSHTPNSRSQWVQGSIFNAYFFYFITEKMSPVSFESSSVEYHDIIIHKSSENINETRKCLCIWHSKLLN